MEEAEEWLPKSWHDWAGASSGRVLGSPIPSLERNLYRIPLGVLGRFLVHIEISLSIGGPCRVTPNRGSIAVDS